MAYTSKPSERAIASAVVESRPPLKRQTAFLLVVIGEGP
jgi:hypothetical protein